MDFHLRKCSQIEPQSFLTEYLYYYYISSCMYVTDPHSLHIVAVVVYRLIEMSERAVAPAASGLSVLTCPFSFFSPLG